MKIKIFIIILTVTALIGCSKDSSETGRSAPQDIDVEVSLMNVSGTRADTDYDSKIHTVDLLVFKRADTGVEADAIFEYAKYAWQKNGSTYRTVLKADEHLNIYVAVNSRDAVDNLVAQGTVTYGQACDALRLSLPPEYFDIETAGLPMWGKILDKTISADKPEENLGTVRLLRSVASADVQVTAADFKLERVYVVYGSDQGYLPFNKITPDDLSINFKADGVYQPAEVMTTRNWFKAAEPGENFVHDKLYMYENGFDGTGNNNYSKIVIEGYWSPDGGSTWNDMSYYPLGFRETDVSSPDYGKKLPVIRNTKFNFVITKVNGDGYPDLPTAKDGEEMNVDFVVIPWNDYDDGNIFIEGNRFFSIGDKKAVLGPDLNSVRYLYFTTDFEDTDIQIRFDTSSQWGNTASTPRFKAEIAKDDDTGKRYFLISVSDVYGTTDNPAILYVKVGSRITFPISVRQDEFAWNGGGNIDTDF